MNTGRYKIADRVFEITSLHDFVHKLSKDYRTEEPVDFRIQTSQEDIDAEAAECENKPEMQYAFSQGYLEQLAVYRKVATLLIPEGVMLFHGSVVAVDGWAYIFTAKSGTGKSTHSALWRQLLGDRAVMVNDDKPLLRINEDGNVVAYGTPWNGKHGLGNNIAVPVKSLALLCRSAENHIEPVTPADAYLALMGQTYMPKDSRLRIQTLAMIDKLAKNVNLFRLGCNMHVTAAQIAYNAMK